MGCGCNSGKTTLKYEVQRKDGVKVTVATLGEAQAIVKSAGGTFRAVQS